MKAMWSNLLSNKNSIFYDSFGLMILIITYLFNKNVIEFLKSIFNLILMEKKKSDKLF